MLTGYDQRGLCRAWSHQTPASDNFTRFTQHARVWLKSSVRDKNSKRADPACTRERAARRLHMPHTHHSRLAKLGYPAQLRPDTKCLKAGVYSLFERLISAASWVVLISSRRGCCSECRCMSPLASPMERRRTPENTDTAIFDLGRGKQAARSGSDLPWSQWSR